MKVKELQKTVNITWSPFVQQPIYLAAGTAAQQFDSSANSTLEIYSPNFSDPSFDLKLKASIPSQFRFQKLIWSPVGYKAAHSNGLIVGGCEAGHIEVYSAAKLLSNEEALVTRQHRHTGAVSGLDFNPFQNNLLASCASESEIFIWDLNNPTTQMNPGNKIQPLEDVKNVAWNRQVQHILASAFSTRCVIWDLRKSQQIIKLSDTQSRVRWHSIQWHPEAATQVWLASEDDQSPVVQLWDLRYATAPAKTYQIHQRGVLGMSWCLQDTDVMVSCGKDNRIYAWNPNTDIAEGEILSEVATTATWYSDVQFCPRNPALIASACLDGNVSIYSLFGGTQQIVQTSNKIADSFPGMDQFAQAPIPQQATKIVYHDLKRAPKWLKKTSGVAFGFGGKLLSFDAKTKNVNITQVATEPKLVERANTLQQSLNNANYMEYCRQRADQMSDQNGRYLWYFLKANFELNPKEELLNLLGYNKEDVERKFSKYIKEDLSHNQHDVDQLTNRISTLTHSDSSEVECDQSTSNSSVHNSQTLYGGLTNTAQNVAEPDAAQPKPQFKIPSGEHTDSLITEAILTGNLEAAVELCLDAKRTAEALIIASTAGFEFLTRIQNRYLQEQQNEMSNVISALVTCDWLNLINRCTVDSWKEALVAALKHSERKAVDICERLGDRLLNECANSVEYTRNAMFCYICAGSIDKLVNAWYKLKQLEQQNVNYKLNTNELQELAEVVLIMIKSSEQQGIALDITDYFADFIKQYAGLLASQGALTAAQSYIFALGTGQQSTKLVELRDRICNTLNYKRPATRGYQQQQQREIQPTQQQQSLLQNAFTCAPAQSQNASFTQQPPVRYSGGSAAIQTPQQQFQANNWQSSAAAPVPPPPLSAHQQPVPTYSPSVPTTAAKIFNPLQAQPKTTKPTSNDLLQPQQIQQPPRPPSTASSHGGSVTATTGGLHARSKYVLDPAVAPAQSTFNYGASVYGAQIPAPAPFTGAANLSTANVITTPTFYNNNVYNTNALSGPGDMQPSQYNPNQYTSGPNQFLPGVAQIESVPPINAIQNIQRNPTPPPGWNDPPTLKSIREQKQPERPLSATAITAPITHPLFGVADPNQNQNGYMGPNQYQNNTVPPSNAGAPTNLYYNPGAPAAIGPGAGVLQNNNSAPQQSFSQLNLQTQAISDSTQQQQIQQQWNTQAQHTFGYTEQPAPIQCQPEPPKVKPPLPEEYIYMQTVLEELKNKCLAATNDARMKRKFVDVAKRLENLYDCLRDGRLTSTTIQYLNQIVQCIQIADYAHALELHTRIAFGTDFSQCAGFMPGLKVLLQLATDLHVALR